MIWRAFIDLHKRRGSTANGPGPITLHDIEAWERKLGGPLEGWEIRAVLMLDDVFTTFVDKQQTARAKLQS